MNKKYIDTIILRLHYGKICKRGGFMSRRKKIVITLILILVLLPAALMGFLYYKINLFLKFLILQI